MGTFERYTRLVGDYSGGVEYPAEPRALYDPIRYTMEDGGKRLRPLFVLGSCGLWRNGVDDALPAAAAVEMFHNFTLMHDDIMDNAPLRRGRESVHRRWGGNVAILSGDALMILSYRELARVRPSLLSAVTAHFNEAAVKVCEGQQLDMDFEGRESVTVAEYVSMIELKTAALFVGAVSMGAVVGGAGAHEVERLREFARQFGVAFQIQDDYLDCYGDRRLGKAVGGDILEGKKTFLKLRAMAAADDADRAELAGVHRNARLAAEQKIARTLELYERYRVRESAEREVSERLAAAAAALDGLAGGVDRTRLEEFKRFALSQSGRAW